MPPLLRRWLHKCHRLTDLSLRASVGKDDGAPLEPPGIPIKCVCAELATEYAKYWKNIQEGNGEGLEEIQQAALDRWHAVRFELGISTEQHPLVLEFFVEVFDDYFFVGSLRQYLTVKLADGTPENSNWAGRTKGKKRSILSRPPEIQIELKRLPDQPWTRVLIQDFLDTLLHEMCHAFLMVYGTPAGSLETWGKYRSVVETEGLTGHGPCWVKVAAAAAAEADRSLGRVWSKWELKIEDSCCLEREALRELWTRYRERSD